MSNQQSSHTLKFFYGTAWKEDRTATLTQMAIEAGFRAIDTANQRRHYFETGVGEALAKVYKEGKIKRQDLFLQTKYTYQRGQDHRLPYNPKASFSTQVAESLESSLEHLGTNYIDSLVLHGPYSGYGWSDADVEVWQAMKKEQEAKRVHSLGVSNVSIDHLEQMLSIHKEVPAFVQNRCYARFGWDREVRLFCQKHKIIYQGFSLLTANIEVLRHPLVIKIAKELMLTQAQVVFSFSRQIGMLPMTGTSDLEHMKQDLESLNFDLPEEVVETIESISG